MINEKRKTQILIEDPYDNMVEIDLHINHDRRIFLNSKELIELEEIENAGFGFMNTCQSYSDFFIFLGDKRKNKNNYHQAEDYEIYSHYTYKEFFKVMIDDCFHNSEETVETLRAKIIKAFDDAAKKENE